MRSVLLSGVFHWIRASAFIRALRATLAVPPSGWKTDTSASFPCMWWLVVYSWKTLIDWVIPEKLDFPENNCKHMNECVTMWAGWTPKGLWWVGLLRPLQAASIWPNKRVLVSTSKTQHGISFGCGTIWNVELVLQVRKGAWPQAIWDPQHCRSLGGTGDAPTFTTRVDGISPSK